jgi:hypothetical protein
MTENVSSEESSRASSDFRDPAFHFAWLFFSHSTAVMAAFVDLIRHCARHLAEKLLINES